MRIAKTSLSLPLLWDGKGPRSLHSEGLSIIIPPDAQQAAASSFFGMPSQGQRVGQCVQPAVFVPVRRPGKIQEPPEIQGFQAVSFISELSGNQRLMGRNAG